MAAAGEEKRSERANERTNDRAKVKRTSEGGQCLVIQARRNAAEFSLLYVLFKLHIAQ